MFPDKMANLLFIASAAVGSVPPKPFAVPPLSEAEAYHLSPQWAQANFHKWEVTEAVGATSSDGAARTEEPQVLTASTPRDSFMLAREETARGYREMVASIYPPASDWDDAID